MHDVGRNAERFHRPFELLHLLELASPVGRNDLEPHQGNIFLVTIGKRGADVGEQGPEGRLLGHFFHGVGDQFEGLGTFETEMVLDQVDHPRRLFGLDPAAAARDIDEQRGDEKLGVVSNLTVRGFDDERRAFEAPEHELIDEYLQRVRTANEQFNDEGGPGWLTERGEVFISIGPPNEIIDRRAEQQISRGRYIIWNYFDYRLTLNFIDDTGFGRFRLDPRSRSEFLRIRNQLLAR